MINKIYVVIKRDKKTGDFIRVCASYRLLNDVVAAVNELNKLSDSAMYYYVTSNYVIGA